jgi:predicted ATPase
LLRPDLVMLYCSKSKLLFLFPLPVQQRQSLSQHAMRLQFASTDERLFGRAKELQILEEVYRQIQQKRGSSHQRNYVDNPQSDDVPSSAGPYLVLLKGMSGNGKTSLVNHFGISCGVAAAAQYTERTDTESRQRLRKHHYNSCYVKGKFNEQHQKPYAAFVEAFEDLLTHILKNRDPETERLSAIRKALQEDEILMEILPSLCDILWSNEDHNIEVTGVLNCDMIPNAPLNSEQAKGQMGRTRRRSRANPMQEELQHSTDGDHPDTLAEEGTMLEQRRQFYYRFQAFVRAVCNDQPYPLILFLDDLQWADSASLELFKAILGDTVSNNLLVVGAYRGQEVEDEEHPLRTALNQLKDPMMEHGRYRELSLNDLELADLNEFVAASLELAPEKTMSLSQVIQRKTHGNIFFSREFLKNLEAQKLLRFDMTFYQWTWQAEEISGSTNISDNVVDLVAVRIRQLPDSAIWILKVCSCLWFSFDSAILELIVMQTREEFENPRKLGQKLLATTLEDRFEKIGNLKIDVKTQSEVVQGLLLATEQGLLDQVQSTSFKFAHDKIREASYGLIREGDERDRMHFVIGEALFRMYHSDQSQQWMLFSSVDQLNKISSHVHSSKLRVRLAEVNLEAAEVATSISAFLPSITYLKAGIKLLGETRWCYQYDLCLKLHSKLAALESSVGQTQEATLVIEEIVNHAESFEDKVSALTTQIESLSVQGKLHQSLDLAFQVVDGLGEHFPLSAKGKKFERRVAEDKAKTARLLRNHTDATILNLPLMKDEKKQYALRILNCKLLLGVRSAGLSSVFCPHDAFFIIFGG